MTTITYLYSHKGPARPAVHTPARAGIAVLLERLVAAWNRRTTERMLEGLPQEIRKDIGWPTTTSK